MTAWCQVCGLLATAERAASGCAAALLDPHCHGCVQPMVGNIPGYSASGVSEPPAEEFFGKMNAIKHLRPGDAWPWKPPVHALVSAA